ncbi:MAG: DUF1778 domain-containing protein [Solirubrobacterales bacterium]|nr:DUF1778 domain-containing protein [Solirubrobacterales bacterium]
MAVKTKRIEIRADPESESRIARAASMRQMSVSSFVLGAAGREAEQVLRETERTVMPTEQFDALMASLDLADHAPRLKEVAQAPRSFERV